MRRNEPFKYSDFSNSKGWGFFEKIMSGFSKTQTQTLAANNPVSLDLSRIQINTVSLAREMKLKNYSVTKKSKLCCPFLFARLSCC